MGIFLIFTDKPRTVTKSTCEQEGIFRGKTFANIFLLAQEVSHHRNLSFVFFRATISEN